MKRVLRDMATARRGKQLCMLTVSSCIAYCSKQETLLTAVPSVYCDIYRTRITWCRRGTK